MIQLPKQDKKYLSLFFSDFSITAAQLEEKNKKRRLSVYFQYPLPPGLIVNSTVKDPVKLATILNEIKLKIKTTETLVVVGLTETKASLHTLFLPKLPPEEVGQAIEHQADSFLPFPYESEYVDWMYLDNKESNKTTILTNAIPKEIVDAYVISLNKACLRPIAFESIGLSLLRLVPEVDRKNCLIVEISDMMTVLVVNNEGGVETSLVETDKNQFLTTIKKIINYYYKSSSLQKDKEETLKIYLCGKGINKEFLAQIQQFKSQPLLLKSGIEGMTPEQDQQLATIVSLAQKSVSPTKDVMTINILPPALIVQYEAIKQQSQEKNLKIILLVFFLFLNLVVFLNFFNLKIKTDKLTSQSNLEDYGQMEDLEKYKSKSVLVNQVFSDIELLQKATAEVTQPSQPNVQITGFSFSQQKKEITLSGWTSTKENLMQYESLLEKTNLFTKVFIPIASLQEETNLNFQMILKL